MTIEEMKNYLNEHNLKVCNDNIIRDDKNHPKCPNPIFQSLMLELQDKGKLDIGKETIYGQCFMSLVEIVLNNIHFKYQTQEIKDDCRLEALIALESIHKNFDRTKGSTVYAYVFRCIYTNMIHVLERNNKEREMMDKLRDIYEDEMSIMNSSRKVVTRNVD